MVTGVLDTIPQAYVGQEVGLETSRKAVPQKITLSERKKPGDTARKLVCFDFYSRRSGKMLPLRVCIHTGLHITHDISQITFSQ